MSGLPILCVTNASHYRCGGYSCVDSYIVYAVVLDQQLIMHQLAHHLQEGPVALVELVTVGYSFNHSLPYIQCNPL